MTPGSPPVGTRKKLHLTTFLVPELSWSPMGSACLHFTKGGMLHIGPRGTCKNRAAFFRCWECVLIMYVYRQQLRIAYYEDGLLLRIAYYDTRKKFDLTTFLVPELSWSRSSSTRNVVRSNFFRVSLSAILSGGIRSQSDYSWAGPHP